MLTMKAQRAFKRISIPQLSEITGIHRRTLQDIEKRGDCMMSNAYKIAKALDISLDELYFPDDSES